MLNDSKGTKAWSLWYNMNLKDHWGEYIYLNINNLLYKDDNI